MEYDWVFAGSGFWKDDDGKEHYKANGGDLICVSNFETAMLDLPISSSQANAELQFEAFTERIPPLGTPVIIILEPDETLIGSVDEDFAVESLAGDVIASAAATARFTVAGSRPEPVKMRAASSAHSGVSATLVNAIEQVATRSPLMVFGP